MLELGHGQVPIKVIILDVRHVHFHLRDGDWLVKPKLSIILGHEGAGVVGRLGEDVVTLRVEDRVGFAWLHDSSGGCGFGLSGRQRMWVVSWTP